MATKEESRPKLKDSELAVEMLKRRLVGEAQLKAAIDYQESVGGALTDILLKLGLVKEAPLKRFLDSLATGKNFLPDGEHELEIDFDKLQVHRKLVEKVPAEIVAEFGILLFFPQHGTRAILLSTTQGADERLAGRLQKLLGVEIRTIELPPEVRRRFLREREESTGGSAASSPGRAPTRGAESAAPVATAAPREGVDSIGFVEEAGEASTRANGSGPDRTDAAAGGAADASRPSGYEGRRRPAQGASLEAGDPHLVLALASLLMKKGVFSKEELKVEVEFARRQER